MADDNAWAPGKPIKIVPVGDVAAASAWIAFARRKMAELSRQGDYLRRTWSPVPGVTIRGETLSGIPRVIIEAGLMIFTAGFAFNADGVEECVIKLAPDYRGPFLTYTKIEPEPDTPAIADSRVGTFINLGEGQGFFILGSPLGSLGVSIGYVVTNAGGITVQPVVAIQGQNFTTVPVVAYLGKFEDGKRLMLIPYEDEDPKLPRVSLFTAKSEVVDDYELPLPDPYVYGEVEVAILEPVVALGEGVVVMLVHVGKQYEPNEPQDAGYFRAQSRDGGITWTYLDKGPLEDILEAHYPPYATPQAVPASFKMAAMANGGAIVVGHGNANFPDTDPLNNHPAVIAFISEDRGETFDGPYLVRDYGALQIMYAPVPLGISPDTELPAVGMLTANDDGDVCLSRSDDGGYTWTELAPVAPGIAAIRGGPWGDGPPYVTTGNVVVLTANVLGIGVHDEDAKTFDLYLSMDMGLTWEKGPQISAAAETGESRDFHYALRIGQLGDSTPANAAIPELYDLWPPP